MNHRRVQPAMLVSRVAIAIPSLCARAETNLRCAAVFSRLPANAGKRKIELTGFEPATSSSRTKRATSLRYSSLFKAGGIIHVILPLASTNLYICRKYGIKNTAWVDAMRCSVGGNYS